jgi:hypothetical protein
VPKAVEDLESFYVMPFTHLVYAVTWWVAAASRRRAKARH